MRQYEVAFIVHPEIEDAAFQEIVSRVQSWIEEAGGKVTKVDLWGKKKLAYEIRKQKEGQYVFLNTELPPTYVSELERNMRLLEPIMRFMVTSVEE